MLHTAEYLRSSSWFTGELKGKGTMLRMMLLSFDCGELATACPKSKAEAEIMLGALLLECIRYESDIWKEGRMRAKMKGNVMEEGGSCPQVSHCPAATWL